MIPAHKFLWFTDTHLDLASVIDRWRFRRHVRREAPRGIMVSGDISTGSRIGHDLTWLARTSGCPVYFVLGNHDYWGRSLEEVHREVTSLRLRHPNLVWLTDSSPVPLTATTALIGTEGWYDAVHGDPRWLRFTLDWFRIRDFYGLPDHESRLSAFRTLSLRSSELITSKLSTALDSYKTVYLLTHFPPWPEATRDLGTFWESFWLPYNVNSQMGTTLEGVMAGRKKRKLVVLAGHTHTSNVIHVSRNIECIVGEASYTHPLRSEQRIYIR